MQASKALNAPAEWGRRKEGGEAGGREEINKDGALRARTLHPAACTPRPAERRDCRANVLCVFRGVRQESAWVSLPFLAIQIIRQRRAAVPIPARSGARIVSDTRPHTLTIPKSLTRHTHTQRWDEPVPRPRPPKSGRNAPTSRLRSSSNSSNSHLLLLSPPLLLLLLLHCCTPAQQFWPPCHLRKSRHCVA